jgi:hypothetical protein
MGRLAVGGLFIGLPSSRRAWARSSPSAFSIGSSRARKRDWPAGHGPGPAGRLPHGHRHPAHVRARLGIGAACVGAAGALLAMFFYIFPDVGATFALLAYVTVALGGFGNVPATLARGWWWAWSRCSPVSHRPRFKYAVVFALYLVSSCGGRRVSSAASDVAGDPLGGARSRSSCSWPSRSSSPSPSAPRDDHHLPLRHAGQAWNLLAGYCGQISLGHAVFFGAGAYTSTAPPEVTGSHRGAGCWRRGGRASSRSASAYPVFTAARSLLRHRHHRGGRDHRHARDQLGLGGGARGLFVPSKRPDSWSTSSSTRASRLLLHRPRPPRARAVDHRAGSEALAPRLLLARDPRGPGRRGQPGHPRGRVQAAGDGSVRRAHRAGRHVLRQYILFIDPESVFPTALQHPHLPRGRARRGGHAGGPWWARPS